MKPTRTHLMRVAAAVSTIAIAASMSTAAAATAAAGPVAGHAATVIGPLYITTAPSTFTNNNNQVSAGNTSLGNQIAT